MKQKQTKFFLLASLVLIITIAVIYISIFRLQVGSSVSAGWWIKSVYDYKEHFTEQIKEPKIIIASGSNALFGVDSRVITSITGYPSTSLSVHAGLNLDFLYFKIQKHLKQGDILVMPLEYFYYYNTEEILSQWFVSNMIAWGETEYLDKISFLSYLAFIANTPKERILNGLYHLGKKSKLPSKNEVMNELKEIHNKKNYKFYGYSHRSLNKYGDILAPKRPNDVVSSIFFNTGEDYTTTNTELDPAFLADFEKIQKLADLRGAKLILTWPVTMRNKLFDLGTEPHQARVSLLSEKLSENGVKIECEPGLFNLHYKFFLNDRYHLNSVGANIRSISLGNCIKGLIENRVETYTFESSLEKVKALEAKYNYGSSGLEWKEVDKTYSAHLRPH